MTFTLALEYTGTFFLAISGIRMAAAHKLDPFGMLVIGFITATGGGTLRDILIDTKVFWMDKPIYTGIIIAAFFFTLIFRKFVVHLRYTFYIFDTLGIGLFTIIGIEKSLSMGYSPMIASFMGVITSVVGGMTRDILLNEAPLILRKEIYATACLVGCGVYFGLSYFNISQSIIDISTFATIVLVRTLAIKFKVSFPTINVT
ncbi:MAG TPA: hypothetical protein DDY13_19910 [Cytophagales bacterium]|jgi:uncharacterized membrane protein YeiH|nr:hypothetical protein [Cytophagales bacterium]